MTMIFKPKEVTKDKLDSLPILAGQMITCSDTGELYFDTSSSQRISISNFIFCETKTDLDNITTYLTDKIYLNKEDNSIWKYNGSNLVNINPKISVEKTTLGLNDLIVENNLISGFIIPFEDYTLDSNDLLIYLNSTLLMESEDYNLSFNSENGNNYHLVEFIDPIYYDDNIKIYLINYKNIHCIRPK